MDKFRVKEFTSFHDALINLDKESSKEKISRYITDAFSSFIKNRYKFSVDSISKSPSVVSMEISSSELDNGNNLVAKQLDFSNLKYKFSLLDSRVTESIKSDQHFIFKLDNHPIVIIENNIEPQCEWNGVPVNPGTYYNCQIFYLNNEHIAEKLFKEEVDNILNKQSNDIIEIWKNIALAISPEQQGELLAKLLTSDCFKPAMSAVENKILQSLIDHNHEQKILGF